MSDHIEKVTLISKKTSGGDIADSGMEFQRELIVNKLPYFLSLEGFTSVTLESMGDIDVKFFTPDQKMMYQLIEAKDHQVVPTEFWKEIINFFKLDRDNPNTYNRFTLACTGLSERVHPLKNGLNRLRNPSSFYDEDTVVFKNSLNAFKDIVKGLEKSEELAEFIFNKVNIDDKWGSLSIHASGMFTENLLKYLPGTEQLTTKDVENIYNQLKLLIISRRNKAISRIEIEAVINIIAGDRLPFLTDPVTIKTKTRNDEYDGKQISFNWEAFFGGTNRQYPPGDSWNDNLIDQLNQTREWIEKNRSTRRIRLLGSRRITAAIAIGYNFPAVTGFNIELEYRGDIWSTDDFPNEQTKYYPLQMQLNKESGKTLVVVISIIKKGVVEEVKRFISKKNVTNNLLEITSNSPILSPKQANMAAQQIKDEVKRKSADKGFNHIDLFFAGPSHLALFLGHRWNAMPKTQCYEWVETGAYVETCLLS